MNIGQAAAVCGITAKMIPRTIGLTVLCWRTRLTQRNKHQSGINKKAEHYNIVILG